MFFKLFLLFTIVPVIELSVLIWVGSEIGAPITISIIILTAVVGAYMVRLEGLGVLAKIERDTRAGVFPAEELLNGLMILVAGALLLTPGFFTDIMGFLFVVPTSRNVIKRALRRYIDARISGGSININRNLRG